MAAPIRDFKTLGQMVKRLKSKPLTIYEIMDTWEMSERSAYRAIEYLKQDGEDVITRRDDAGNVLYSVL